MCAFVVPTLTLTPWKPLNEYEELQPIKTNVRAAYGSNKWETGVVSAMFAPYEEGMSLLNISTFSTNVSLVDLSYTASAYTYMEAHGVPSAGDWALERFDKVLTRMQ